MVVANPPFDGRRGDKRIMENAAIYADDYLPVSGRMGSRRASQESVDRSTPQVDWPVTLRL
jgi:hypothetical protein